MWVGRGVGVAALPAHGSVTAPIVCSCRHAPTPYSGCVRTVAQMVVTSFYVGTLTPKADDSRRAMPRRRLLHSDATSDAYVGAPSTSFFF